jgi:hypothetical protein
MSSSVTSRPIKGEHQFKISVFTIHRLTVASQDEIDQLLLVSRYLVVAVERKAHFLCMSLTMLKVVEN